MKDWKRMLLLCACLLMCGCAGTDVLPKEEAELPVTKIEIV